MSESTEILISAAQLADKVKQLGQQIRKDHGDNPVILLGVLKGSFPFLADLARAIPGEVIIDFIHTSSYDGAKESSGTVKIRRDHDINIENQHVIVVEDIVDTGLTLKHLLDILKTRNPASLKVAAALSKPAAHEHHVPIDYLGFDIENVFVVGYGLDYAERFRQLPDVCIYHSN